MILKLSFIITFENTNFVLKLGISFINRYVIIQLTKYSYSWWIWWICLGRREKEDACFVWRFLCLCCGENVSIHGGPDCFVQKNVERFTEKVMGPKVCCEFERHLNATKKWRILARLEKELQEKSHVWYWRNKSASSSKVHQVKVSYAREMEGRKNTWYYRAAYIWKLQETGNYVEK